jgi:hypothetical protein
MAGETLIFPIESLNNLDLNTIFGPIRVEISVNFVKYYTLQFMGILPTLRILLIGIWGKTDIPCRKGLTSR